VSECLTGRLRRLAATTIITVILGGCAALPPPTLPVTVTVGTRAAAETVATLQAAKSYSLEVEASDPPAPAELMQLAKAALAAHSLQPAEDDAKVPADLIIRLSLITETSKAESFVDRITNSSIWVGTGGSGFNLSIDLSGPKVIARSIRWQFKSAQNAQLQQEITARVSADKAWDTRAMQAVLRASLRDFPEAPVSQRVIQQPLTDQP
jgi:hypothetical protein